MKAKTSKAQLEDLSPGKRVDYILKKRQSVLQS